jgi:uncharacterized protein
MSQRDKFNLILQELASSGRQWDESIPASVLADESFADLDMQSPQVTDMTWQGSLERCGEHFVLKGVWRMAIPRQCGRCTAEFVCEMSGDVDEVYAIKPSPNEGEQPELQLTGEEPEILVDGKLDILHVLREHFWLAWQPLVVCSEACKGLCLQCGVDLNKGGCDCHQNVKDNAFAALKDFKFDA